ncbi:phage tail domain-containing protein [Paenibacillus ehimensis]|uniref:phage tail domain-containing protein n=1 Tax=Paenibacillus ehimensis TaxID=79264 RepID=UPI000470DC2D|nr:phage tail domain-containing protein [Paenibacillus ehimensis]
MSFQLGAKTAKELGLILLRSSQRPALPNTRDRLLQISGRHGSWDFGADLEARHFSLECAWVTKNAAELQVKTVELAAHLVDSYGRPRDLELRFDTRPGQYFTVRYSGSFPVERIAGLGKFSLPLVAFDPFAYGPEKIYETTITASPFSFEIDSGGNVRTQPVIVLTNAGTNTIRSFKIVNEYLVE